MLLPHSGSRINNTAFGIHFLGCQHLIFSSDGAQLRLLQRELRLKELSQIFLSISISVDTSRFKAVTSFKPDSS